MKRLIVLLFVTPLVLASCTTSKMVMTLDIPRLSPSKADSVDIAQYEEQYGDYDAVYLEMSEEVEHSGGKSSLYNIGNNWSYHIVYREKYIVFNPENEGFTTVTLFTKPRDIYIRVVDPDRSVRMYDFDDMIEVEDNYDSKDYKFVIPNVQRGTLIETGYDVLHSVHPVFAPLDYYTRLQLTVPVEKMRFSYAYPDWWEIKVKQLGEIRVLSYTVDTDSESKKKIITYRANNVPALTLEPYAPYFKENGAYIELMITKLEMMGAKLDIPQDWDHIVEGFNDNAIDKFRPNNDMMDSVTRAVTAACTDRQEKLEAIVDYIHEEIKLGREHKSGNVAKIIREKGGSSTDISCLAYGMMKRAGLLADLVLVHSGFDGYFDHEYVTTDQFQYPAVIVDIDQAKYVVFPYIKYLAVNEIPPFLLGQIALVVSDGDRARFTHIPEQTDQENRGTDNFTVTLADDGLITVDGRKEMTGLVAYELRDLLEDASDEEREELIRSYAAFEGASVNIVSYEIENEDDCKKPLVITMNYTIDNMLMVAPDEAVFQTGGLLSPATFEEGDIQVGERVNPIRISYDVNLRKKITVVFPEEWQLSTTLSGFFVENMFGSARATYAVEAGKMTIDQAWTVKKSSAPKEKINHLRELLSKDSDINVPSIVFITAPQASSF